MRHLVFHPLCAMVPAIAALLAGVIACSKTTEPGTESASTHTLTLSMEGTRTSLGPADVQGVRLVYWSNGDAIVANGQVSRALEGVEAGSTSATFYFEDALSYPCSIVYPASMYADGQILLPAIQSYVEGTFADNVSPAAASINQASGNVVLRNPCGVLRCRLVQGDTPVSLQAVSFQGNDGEQVSGAFELDFAQNALRPTSTALADKSVSLHVGGIALSDTPLDLFLVVPARTYEKGFAVTFLAGDGTRMVARKRSSAALEQSRIGVLPVLSYKSGSEIEVEFRTVAPGIQEDWDEPKPDPEDPTPSGGATANCYIVSKSGTYSFPTVKGNSNESVGEVVSAEVLWESFGTDEQPSVGDLIASVSYKAGRITYSTPSTMRNGNAVIAAKDASGEILWSWHIWLCKGFNPNQTGQVYVNNAGTMMDRNLGATSASPGSVGALGLLYQWGRKDPFLGSSSITENIEAKSTVAWPKDMEGRFSDSIYGKCGSMGYANAHPMTFIQSSGDEDWLRPSYKIDDEKRWASSKAVYDPCPVGWRVPDGGTEGVWMTASASNYFTVPIKWDINKGVLLSEQFDSQNAVWYPLAGMLWYNNTDHRRGVGRSGDYWSCTPDVRGSAYSESLYLSVWMDLVEVYTKNNYYSPRACAYSVRCQKIE